VLTDLEFRLIDEGYCGVSFQVSSIWRINPYNNINGLIIELIGALGFIL
jgi:hypothetical protein